MVEKNNSAYKTIGEVAELLNLVNSKTGNLSTHTIRFWEKQFTQIKPKIFAGKRRYYDNESIEILKKIKYLLKDKGFTIKGVKNYLINRDSSLDDLNNTSINKKKILKKKLIKISNLVKDLKKYNGKKNTR